MKSKKEFICNNCSYKAIKWLGCCPECQEWGSLIEQQDSVQPTAKLLKKATSLALHPLSSITLTLQKRLLSGIAEWDRVIGGGVIPGSFIILTGDPGIGKSTLLLQVSYAFSVNYNILYFSSEESLEQVKIRAERLKCSNERLLFSDEGI